MFIGDTCQPADMGHFASICDRNTSGLYHQHGPKPVLEEHPSNLKIVIIGAGIGGLTAAIGLRRNGHEIHVSNLPPQIVKVFMTWY